MLFYSKVKKAFFLVDDETIMEVPRAHAIVLMREGIRVRFM